VSVVRAARPGATRTCPHCRATILESEAVCPACHHHLRAGKATALVRRPVATPLSVTGMLRCPDGADAAEYVVVLAVRDEHGAEVSRQVMAVGALHAGQERAFTLEVQTMTG
jgi:hypothetical protein